MNHAQDHIPPDSRELQAVLAAFDAAIRDAGISEQPLVREALAAAVRAALEAGAGELRAAQNRIDTLTDSLSEMVRQFGFIADGGLRHTGGIPVLEGAFAALGLTDPHPAADDGEPCDEPGCLQRAVVSFPSNEHGFRRTCWDHASPDAAPSSEAVATVDTVAKQPGAETMPRRMGMSLLVMQQALQGSKTRRSS